MDDTLVLTSKCDKFAYVDVRQLAKELLPQVVEESLISAFRRGMASTPWDKEHKIHVDEWRAGLWNNALTEHRGSKCKRAPNASCFPCVHCHDG